MTDDPIGDELHKLSEEFKKLLGESFGKQGIKETTPEELSRLFGLTLNQAKAWLKKEPNYIPADGFSQHEKQPKNSQNRQQDSLRDMRINNTMN
jgi:hypothetical protein